jgi:hypothetical protein
MSTRKEHNAASFFRYHNGLMSEVEMHELEKASLEDSFLADALDGYIYSSDPVNEVDGIKKILSTYSSKKSATIVNFKKYALNYGIAVSFIIIFISFYFILKPKKNYPSEFAKIEKKAIPEKKSDSSGIAITNNQSAEFKKEETIQIAENHPVNPLNKRSTLKNRIKSTPSFKTITMSEVIDSAKPFLAMQDDENTSKIVTEDAITFNSPITQQKFEAQTAPAVSVVEQPVNDIEIASIATVTKKPTLTSKATAAQENNDQLNRSKSLVDLKNDKATFENFIALNKPKCFDENGKSITGIIELSFKVDKTGTPMHIKFKKTYPGNCNEEAKRLLKVGPKWLHSIGEKINIEIPY